jgi:TfoX/Sxy family transcriptional regulator of competence genes
MASDKEYLTFVLELLREVRGISYKKMMGEYILYYNKIIFGGIYDNRFLIKKVPQLEKYNLKEEIPYPNAKNMYLIDIEDSRLIKEIILELVNNL